MNVATEEKMKQMLLQEIAYNKNKLREKLNVLKSRQCQNNLLTNVVDDYESFYQKVKEREEKHQLELQYISNYLNHIIETNDLTDHGLNRIKHDQSQLLQQLHSIKEKINSI